MTERPPSWTPSSDDELSRRPEAAWLGSRSVEYLSRPLRGGRRLTRVRALRTGSHGAGQGDPLHRLYPVLPRIWYVRGKLAEAADLLDGAIEAARLIGSPPALAGNLFNRSAVALAVGDLDLALATAEESFDLARALDPGFVTAWAAARLANVLFESGNRPKPSRSSWSAPAAKS